MNATEERPNPDSLLESIKQEELNARKGKLKIFFGMCAGVGKTYTMLEAAQKAKHERIDVVIGLVETHNRRETQLLLEGLEFVHLKEIEYRGTVFKEMDLDSVLERKPELVIVDELAHTNIPGSRHVKRYQDVFEILNNGIDVYTTLNVQHIESRAETVRQITGSVIRETVPDSVFEKADEVELVDIIPDELLKRLSEGKVYTPERSQQAIRNFFRKGNLTALREMALRMTAERVDWQLRDYKTEMKIDAIWKSSQRLMVAVSPSPYSADLIRWTRRLAYSMETSWIAVYVETGQKISEENKELIQKNFNLARELGAEIITVSDKDLVGALIRTAKENNVTQIIVGKSREKKFLRLAGYHDIVERLIKNSGDIDVYVVGGDKKEEGTVSWKNYPRFQSSWLRYQLAMLIVIIVGVFCYSVYKDIGYQTVSLLFLLTVSLLPLFNFGPGPTFLAALLSALSWNFFFIPPQYTFHIYKVEDALMFVMYFIVAIVSGFLTARIRSQEIFVKQREKRTNALYNLTKDLSAANDLNEAAEVSVKNITQHFDVDVVLFLLDQEKKLSPASHLTSTFSIDDGEWRIAQWAYLNKQKCGMFTNTLPLAFATYYPLNSLRNNLGVLGIKTKNEKPLLFDQQILLDTFIAQITTTLEREYLNELAKESLVVSESEKLYKTLFNSISHELKTPITTIISAASSFSSEENLKNENFVKKILREINIAAERLNRLVENLLDMARLESGVLKLKSDWHDISDLIYGAVNRLKNELTNHKLTIEIQKEIKLFKFDYGLMEQALINIIHNSVTYTREGSEILINVKTENDSCVISIADNGAGFTEETLPKLFQKFYRVPQTKTGGTGLGLSIAKGFIEAHKGSVKAENRETGGAMFTIKLPMN